MGASLRVSTYRKKPVEVQAVQWDGSDLTATQISSWIVQAGGAVFLSSTPLAIVIITLEGNMEVKAGDWVIRGVKGEFYPCKPDIFVATYDQADT